jgi:hypothetical protein
MRSIAPILLISWPGEASRPLESFVFGSARAVLDCLASLRPAERMQRELASSVADAEWSAAAAKPQVKPVSGLPSRAHAEECRGDELVIWANRVGSVRLGWRWDT